MNVATVRFFSPALARHTTYSVILPETGETLVDELGRRSFTTSVAYGPTIGKNIALAYLMFSERSDILSLCLDQFDNADNMTERLTALAVLVNSGFEAERDGRPIMQCRSIAHLGGATLDNEENYLIKKLFTALGAIQIENQARI